MADGASQFPYRAGQPYLSQAQVQNGNHFPRHISRAGSPPNNFRGGFSNDTPSPSRSPGPSANSHLYGMYNSQTHHQGQHVPMNNGVVNNQRYGMQMNMPKFPSQHQTPHQEHATHAGPSTTHQHTYSGGLSSATPQFTPNHLQNGNLSNGQVGMSDYAIQQQQLAIEARQSSGQHYHAKHLAKDYTTFLNATQIEEQKRLAAERNGSKKDAVTSQSYWKMLDCGGLGARVIAPAVFNYTFLTRLFFNYNKLTELPAAIGKLKNLTHLDLSGNLLSELPREIGMLVRLKTLLLIDNNLQNLPFEIGFLYQLETIGVEGNSNIPAVLRSELYENGTAGLVTYLREESPIPMPPSQRDWIVLNSTPDLEEERFTVLDYNILCDKYATRAQYGYTPSHALQWDYRKDLILNEVRAHNADIVCLQEVDAQSFNEYFRPELAYNDYKGSFQSKGRARTMHEHEAKLVDGCATFYKGNKYILLDKQIVDFANIAINRPDMKGEHDIFNRVGSKDNVALITFFENRQTGSRIIIVNAHVFWDPAFTDVKVVQVAILMERIAKLAEGYAKWPPCTDKAAFRHSEANDNSDPESSQKPLPEPKPSMAYANGPDIPLVLCGDFNSTPDSDSGAYILLANGVLEKNHTDIANRTYGKFTREGMAHPFSLKSAYSHIGELSFTNYTPGFTAVIDYIWYSANALEVIGLLGELDQEYLQRVPGFPNYHFPSDHLPLLSEFSVKEQSAVPKDKGEPHRRR